MKPTDIRYDSKKGKYIVNKVDNETTYYIGAAKICPICHNYINGYPALSRKDNKTEICSNCGTLEALKDLKKELDKEKIKESIIKKFIFNFSLTKEQEQQLIDKHYSNDDVDRLEVFGIIYEILKTKILERFEFDIEENMIFDEYVNDVISDLVLKYVG